VPRPVGGEDLPGLGDKSWLRREHGDERSPRVRLLEIFLAHQAFVGQRAADGGGGALQEKSPVSSTLSEVAVEVSAARPRSFVI